MTIVIRLEEEILTKLKEIDSNPNEAISKLLKESTNRFLINRLEEDERIRSISKKVAEDTFYKIVGEARNNY